jgi:hypothetical protein
MLTTMQPELGWSWVAMTGAFSLALVVLTLVPIT